MDAWKTNSFLLGITYYSGGELADSLGGRYCFFHHQVYPAFLRLLTSTFLSSNQFDVVTSLAKVGGGVPNPFGKKSFPSKLDHFPKKNRDENSKKYVKQPPPRVKRIPVTQIYNANL